MSQNWYLQSSSPYEKTVSVLNIFFRSYPVRDSLCLLGSFGANLSYHTKRTSLILNASMQRKSRIVTKISLIIHACSYVGDSNINIRICHHLLLYSLNENFVNVFNTYFEALCKRIKTL